MLFIMNSANIISLLILLFWLVHNLYFLIMSVFLIDGRDSDTEVVRVCDAEKAVLTVSHGTDKGKQYEGITAMMTEHKVRLFLDEGDALTAGTPVDLVIESADYKAKLTGTVTDVHLSTSGAARTHTVEILDFNGTQYDYLGLLYDRIPTLPQSLQKDFGIFGHLWQNIVHRVARTRQ